MSLFEPPTNETRTPAHVPPPPFRLRDLVNTPGKIAGAVVLFLLAFLLLAVYGFATYGPAANV